MRIRPPSRCLPDRRCAVKTNLSTIVDRLGREVGLLSGCPSDPKPAAEVLSRSGIYLDPAQLKLTRINPSLLSNRILGSEDFRRHRDRRQRRRDGYLLDRAFISVGLDLDDFVISSDQDEDGTFITGIHLASDYKLDQIKALVSDPPRGDSAIVRKTLLIEYGHLLPILDGKGFRARDIDVIDLHFGAEHHADTLAQKPITDYQERLTTALSDEAAMLPQGVVIKKRSGGYRVLDGYHRLHAVLTDADRNTAGSVVSRKRTSRQAKVTVWEAY